jgi:hypothetical protein
MINLPYIAMPDHFVKLLCSNIQNTTQTNNNLEMYINDNRELYIIIKKVFKDIDPDGFLGKIVSVSGWPGIRNRLGSVFIEYALNGFFPDSANINLVNELVTIENKLRHFTAQGYSRAFLLGMYSKMSLIKINQMEEVHQFSPLIITDEHIDLMKFSKSKSVRIDWLILQLVLFENVLGMDTLRNMMKAQMKFAAIFNMLKPEEKEWFMQNMLTYGASILDFEFFMTDTSLAKEAV